MNTNVLPPLLLSPLLPPPAAAASPEVFRQLGLITRQLHDTLHQLGVMPGLQRAADDLPDVRSRLSYIARKTGEAADKVLNSVDQAKLEHSHNTRRMGHIAQVLADDPVRAVASGAVPTLMAEVDAASARIDQHLTDIMLAQDFHDLTSQVVAKVVTLASKLEDSLIKLLLQAAPPEQAQRTEQVHKADTASVLAGPVVSAEDGSDVVANQSEVDDMLASLGF